MFTDFGDNKLFSNVLLVKIEKFMFLVVNFGIIIENNGILGPKTLFKKFIALRKFVNKKQKMANIVSVD